MARRNFTARNERELFAVSANTARSLDPIVERDVLGASRQWPRLER